MIKPQKNTLLYATLTIVLAALLIQGAAFAGAITFGREKLKGTSKTQGDFNLGYDNDPSSHEAWQLTYWALSKVQDNLRSFPQAEKTPQENTKRVVNPPKDPRVTHLEKARDFLNTALTDFPFDCDQGAQRSGDAQALIAQAIVKINEAMTAIAKVYGGNNVAPMPTIKNLLVQANQELKLANAKTDTKPNTGK